MTRPLSSGLQAHVEGGGTSLAWFFKITRSDNTVYAWTSTDRDVVIGSDTYLAAPGFDVSSLRAASGLAVGNNELTALEDPAAFVRLEVLAGKWDGAKYEFFQANYADTTQGAIAWPYGRLGNITPNYGTFTVELRDLRQALQQDTTAIFQEPCRYRFGDTRCGLHVADFTVTGTITAVPSQKVVIDSSRSEAADWFGYGEFTFTSGQNAGLTFKVKEYTNGEFTFDTAAVYPIEIGDTYSAVAGDRHRWIEDCRDKFSNVLNFGGDPAKPTTDAVVAPPSESPLTIPAPSPAPAPSPSPPTPGAFNAAGRTVAVDYTQTYDAGNVADLSRYGILIRGMTIGHAVSDGASYKAALAVANPDCQLAQYVKLNEMKAPQSSGEDFYSAWVEANTYGWWVLSQPAGTRVSTYPGSEEMNITAATTVNGSGQRWPPYKAAFDFSNTLTHFSPPYVFCDNAWTRPRVTADYAETGTGNQTPTASATAYTAGNTAWVTAIRANSAGIKTIANADNDLSAFPAVFHAGFNEGCVGRSYGTFANGGITAVRARQLAHIANTIDGMAILMSYGESTDYKAHRFAKCMAMLFDSWHCACDSTPQLHGVWLDENGQALGVRTDPVPSAATSNGIWACRFETGIVLVNPTTADATIDVSGLGTYKHFTGTQDAVLNDGSTIAAPVTVRALDGLVLIDV